MKALVIDPEAQSIEEINIGGQEDLIRIIGYDTITSDEIGPDGE